MNIYNTDNNYNHNSVSYKDYNNINIYNDK